MYTERQSRQSGWSLKEPFLDEGAYESQCICRRRVKNTDMSAQRDADNKRERGTKNRERNAEDRETSVCADRQEGEATERHVRRMHLHALVVPHLVGPPPLCVCEVCEAKLYKNKKCPGRVRGQRVRAPPPNETMLTGTLLTQRTITWWMTGCRCPPSALPVNYWSRNNNLRQWTSAKHAGLALLMTGCELCEPIQFLCHHV